MRYFLDTEFDEDGHTIELISIAVVAEDGREFFAVSSEFDPNHCNDWVQANVLPKLPSTDVVPRQTKKEIAAALRAFVTPDPELWAFFADYDWVVVCQLFGRMIDLPKDWPMFCMDLKQELESRNIPRSALPPDPPDEHDALVDARWVREAFQVMRQYVTGPESPEQALRAVLWRQHGHWMAAHGDDTELMCTICLIDFKRATPEEIEERLNEARRLDRDE